MRRPSNAYRPPGAEVTSRPRAASGRRPPTRPASRAAVRSRTPNSIPKDVCSISAHAPPRPRIARPSEMWSSVTTILATSPGLRRVLAPTSSPSLARAGRGGERGERRPALEDRLVGVAEDRVHMVPGPDVVVAQVVDLLRGGQVRRPVGGLVPEENTQLQITHGPMVAWPTMRPPACRRGRASAAPWQAGPGPAPRAEPDGTWIRGPSGRPWE